MIKEDAKMKYDKEIGQYYITKLAIINETPITDGDLKDKFGDTDEAIERELKTLSQRVYSYMFGLNYPENNKWLRFKIYNNTNQERYFLKEAIKSFVRGAMESDMDLNDYVDRSESFPMEVKRNLQNANLIGLRMFRGKVPEGDY